MTITLPPVTPTPPDDTLPSTSTKRQIVEMAYEECSLAGYEFNVTPEELFSGLRKLDALMARWKVSSKDLSYNAPLHFGDGDLDDVSGIPDAAIEGAAISLAMAIAQAMGKQMSGESRARLNNAMSAISALAPSGPNRDGAAAPSPGQATAAGAAPSFTPYTAPTISNPPMQAEVQALADAVDDMGAALSSLISLLQANGNLT